MTTFKVGTGGSDVVSIEERIRLEDWAVSANAEEGSVATSTIPVDDPDGDLFLRGLQSFSASEPDIGGTDSENILYYGFTADREVSRGPSFLTGAARRWSLNTVDVNSVLSRRVMVGSDNKRPAETDVERVQWLLTTSELGMIHDDTYVNTSGPVNMDAADYNGQYGYDILNDCAQASGKNFWVLWRGDLATFGLWYDFAASTEYTSPLSISNVLADVDGVSVFAASFDSVCRIDPSRVFSGLYLPYDGGAVYRQRTATSDVYYKRDTTAYSTNVKTTAKANARADRILDSIATEEYRITTTVIIPDAQVQQLREGHRVLCKFSHFDGFQDWTWLRVLNRTTKQLSEEYYQVTVEMSGEAGATALTCSTTLGTLTGADPGDGTGEPYDITPATPATDAVVLALWGGFNSGDQMVVPFFGIGNPSNGLAYLDAPYTSLLLSPTYHTVFVTGYNAVSATSPGAFVPSYDGGAPAVAWDTLSVAIPTTATSPVSTGYQVGASSGGVTPLSSTPTPGNILVNLRAGEQAHDTVGGLPVAPGWTRLVGVILNDGGASDLALAIEVRCVEVGDTDEVFVTGDSFTHWNSCSEWTLDATDADAGSGSGTGPASGGSGPIFSPTTPVATLSPSDSAATFRAAVANLSYGTIELRDGEYDWQNVDVSVDRTAVPLTIRPTAIAADVAFIGPATTSGIIFLLGQTSLAKYIAFDGRPGGVGSSVWTFRDIELAQSGVFEPRGTDHCSLSYIKFSGLSRNSAPGNAAYKSWGIYISGAGSGNNDELILDHLDFLAPASSKEVSAIQIDSSGSHGHIKASNITIADHYYGLYDGRPTTNLELLDWVMTGVGSGSYSIRIAPGALVNGSYTNVDATGSDVFSNGGTGTMTDGGGNSGI